VPLEPGDRLVCATTGAPAVQNPQGFELGEKEFFKLVLQHSARTTEQMLDGVLAGIEAHADGAPFPTDLSIVAVSRPA